MFLHLSVKLFQSLWLLKVIKVYFYLLLLPWGHAVNVPSRTISEMNANK